MKIDRTVLTRSPFFLLNILTFQEMCIILKHRPIKMDTNIATKTHRHTHTRARVKHTRSNRASFFLSDWFSVLSRREYSFGIQFSGRRTFFDGLRYNSDNYNELGRLRLHRRTRLICQFR